MSRKKHFLVVDVETCNDLDFPIPYDIGYAICDRKGNIYLERSFIIPEVFYDYRESLMQSAYYANKIPQYDKDIKNGIRKVIPMWKARKIMLEDMKDFNVYTVCSYNCSFDRKALNTLIRYISKSFWRYWFPRGVTYECIWSMACQLLLARKSYIKFALKNNMVSPSDNLQTSAEATYKYLIGDENFLESHTGLEDVKIEVDIMAKCYAQKKKMDKSINRLCWKIPQKKRKELGL